MTSEILKTTGKSVLLFSLFLFGGIWFFPRALTQEEPEFSRIEPVFRTAPDTIQTSVYWYWISDNISAEGVVRDLQAMKRAGINRAFIGNIGLQDVPYGKVKMLSEEWWKILHEALKTATELDIDIGIFNSPGWSQSGGPWVGPGKAMRYLAASEMRVKGPRKLSERLPAPRQDFQDVRIIAFPAPKEDLLTLGAQNGKVTSAPAMPGLEKITDRDRKTWIPLPSKAELAIRFESPAPFTARSLSVYPAEQKLLAQASLQTLDAQGGYRTLAEFEINRSNPALNVGFEPYAPVVISLPATAATAFRLIVANRGTTGGLAEVELASAPLVERFSEKTLARMHPTPLPYWKDYQWPVQPEVDDRSRVVDPSRVLDLTRQRQADGTLNWQVPEGEWVILRTGMTPTGTTNSPASPEATGLEVDKMSRQYAEDHFYGHMGEILKRIPEADRRSFKVVVQDSYETGGQNFTDGFLEEFQKKYGYDPLPYLPVYFGKVVGSRLESDRFLWDLRRLIADKVAYDYVGGLREVSHRHGLRTWLENYGHWGFPSEFLMYGGQSDEISGEFWSEGELGNIENRAATSCGHIYGKTRISAESNTCSGRPFARYPAVIKQRGDRFFAEGINNTLLHVYITQPYEDRNPGVNAWFGNEFNRKNTWFSQMDVYVQYLKRTNFLLQQGQNVADVAYFIGEDAPKMTGVADPPLPTGYQFDYINAEVIGQSMTVRDGRLTLPHGTSYRVLVLPKLETMRPELLDKIRRLVYDGGVALGPAPKRSPSQQNQPQADRRVAALAAELWGEVDGLKVKSRRAGKGMIACGMTLPELLERIGASPDCRLPADNSIHYGHRTLPEGEIYFLSNQTASRQSFTAEFRVRGMQPELWEAVTGAIRTLPSFGYGAGSTSVPLRLEPWESAFVVFRRKEARAGATRAEANYPEPAASVEIRGPWTVQFEAAMRGPAAPVVFDALQDWSASADERIRFYSGTASYTCAFRPEAQAGGSKLYLDLGRLTAMAKVTVNGRYAGGAWTAPYRVDITGLVRPGENELKIEVVNTWVNRLIGDSRLPADQRPTWCPVNPYRPDSPLQPSGLFGPVKILTMNP